MRTLLRLWHDDHAFVAHVELLFILSVLAIGTLTGLVALRQAVIAEGLEQAAAIIALNDSFSFTGQSNCESSHAGSSGAKIGAGFDIKQDTKAPALVGTVTQSPCD
jgi:hypothetical protein